MDKRLWWVTRPTRDLHDIEKSFKCFAKIADGQQWRGNRELHERFEVENPVKTTNAGRYGSRGSGGRTWAAWLRSWGLWYEAERVILTGAGELIANSSSPNDVRKQIIHQIMTFQILSAYHVKLKLDSDFKIFPFRFMLKLLLDEDVKFLHLDEIALFLLQVKQPGEYASVVTKILDWRKNTGDPDTKKRLLKTMYKEHMSEYKDSKGRTNNLEKRYKEKIKNVARTLAFNISYMTEINYDRKSSTISIRRGSKKATEKIFNEYDKEPFCTLYEYSEATFARRFGMRFNRLKASSKDTQPMTQSKKQYDRIAEAVTKLRQEGDVVESDLPTRVQGITNDPIDVIRKILAENPDLDQPTDDDSPFRQHYLECASDGQKHAEFERLTRKIITNIGFVVNKRKISNTTREIDGLILNRSAGMSGLLECKGGKKYAFPVGDCDKMKHTYIKNFKKEKIDGIVYNLDFFVYVVGASASGLDNFNDIIQGTGVRGAVIYARDLLKMHDAVKAGDASPIEAWNLFRSNKHITIADL